MSSWTVIPEAYIIKNVSSYRQIIKKYIPLFWSKFKLKKEKNIKFKIFINKFGIDLKKTI